MHDLNTLSTRLHVEEAARIGEPKATAQKFRLLAASKLPRTRSTFLMAHVLAHTVLAWQYVAGAALAGRLRRSIS